MPATRRSSRAAAAKGMARQSTLSFNNRVSKAGASKVSAKEAAAAAAPSKESKRVVEPSDQVEVEAQKPEVLGDDAEETGEQVAQAEVPRSPAELRADRVTDAQIKKYWREVEAVRIARRVHQEDLSLAEKVLRYFDISSQYGVSDKPHRYPIPRSHRPSISTRAFSPYLGFPDRSMTTDRATALHRDTAREAMATCREVGPQPTHRGPGRAAEGGEAGAWAD